MTFTLRTACLIHCFFILKLLLNYFSFSTQSFSTYCIIIQSLHRSTCSVSENISFRINLAILTIFFRVSTNFFQKTVNKKLDYKNLLEPVNYLSLFAPYLVRVSNIFLCQNKYLKTYNLII